LGGIKADNWMRLTIPVLVFLAASHMLFSRILSRVGIFIPKSGTVQAVFGWLVWTGNLAGNLLMVLAMILVAGVALRLWQRSVGHPLLPLSMLLLPLLVLWAALHGGQLNNYLFIALAGLTLVIAGQLSIRGIQRAGGWRDSLWLASLAGLVALSLIVGFLTALGQSLGSAIMINFGTLISNAAQVLLVGSGFIIFVSYSVKPGMTGVLSFLWKIGLALPVAGAFLWVYLLERYTVTTLLQWSLGLQIVLPVWFYAASLAFFIIGFFSLANDGEFGRTRAWGTLLVVLAGYQMPYTTDLLLVILGLSLLSFPGVFQDIRMGNKSEHT